MDSPRMWENGLEFHWCSPCCVLINQELLLPSVLNMHTILSISSLDFKEVCVYGLSLFSPPPLLYSTFLCCWLWDLSEMQTGSYVSDPSACLLSLLSGSTVPSHTQPCMSSTWTPVGFPKNSRGAVLATSLRRHLNQQQCLKYLGDTEMSQTQFLHLA